MIDPKKQRRVCLTLEEIGLISAALHQLTVPVAVELRGKMEKIFEEEMNPAQQSAVKAYLEAAGAYCVDGDLELDGDAEVSLGDDPGAYVMMWKWIDAEEAGLETGDDGQDRESYSDDQDRDSYTVAQ